MTDYEIWHKKEMIIWQKMKLNPKKEMNMPFSW